MKNKIVTLVCLSFMNLAMAQELTVEVKDFDFEYNDPMGEGTASSFSLNSSTIQGGAKVYVEKMDDEFNIKVSSSEERELSVKNAPDFFLKAEKMKVGGFNFSLYDRAVLSLSQGSFLSRDGELNLQNLSLNFNRDRSQKELIDQMINGCIVQMSLKASKFNSSQMNEGNLASLLMLSFLSSVKEENFVEAKSGFEVKALDIKTKSGRFELTAEIKAQISGKVKSNGHLSYEPLNKRLTIKINEVKFGILNITSKVFDELKKKESDKLKVGRPFVYYSLK